jgi:hypothetical protein
MQTAVFAGFAARSIPIVSVVIVRNPMGTRSIAERHRGEGSADDRRTEFGFFW